MRVLVAEDDLTNRRLMEVVLARWGFEVVVACDGTQAWEILQRDDAPPVAVLDWMMPGLDGAEVCRRVRAAARARPIYLIIVTARATGEDVIAGLEAGADDYVVKPFKPAELRARVQVGARTIELQSRLAQRERELGAAQALITERERFDAAVSAMSDCVVAADGEWRVVTANRAARLLLHLTASADERPPLGEMLAPFRLSPPAAELLGSRERETAVEIARPETRPPLFLDGRLTRVFDESGQLSSVILAARDVTAERQAGHVRADLLTLLSHKLRTPVTVLIGFVDMLRKLSGDAAEEREQVIETCMAQLRRLREMIDDLLDLKARSTQQARGSLAAPAPVGPAVTDALAALRARYPERSLETDAHVAPPGLSVDMHGDDLRLVLGALLDNAVKFGDKDPVRVRVEAEDDGRAGVRLRVSDNGPGIPHEYFDRIFEGFVQIEDRVTGQVRGLGVGLCMARQVVSAYGGAISVGSRLREGTTFTLVLPAAALGEKT